MLSPHISSAFAQERQARYRHEAEVQRLARSRTGAVRRTGTRARSATAAPPARLGTASCRPSPAH